MNEIGKNRYIYIDIAKFIAIFAVVYNHMSIEKYSNNFLFIDSIFNYLFRILVSIHIPLFLLVSGALVLGKEYKIKDVLKKILKIIVLCVILNILYYIMFSLTKKSSINVIEFLRAIYSSNPYPIIWYLPKIYIPFLLLTPLLQKAVKSFKNEHFIFYTLVFIFFKIIIRVFEKFFALDLFIIDSSLFISDILFLPIIGYFISNTSIKFDLNKILVIIGIGIFSLIPYNYLYHLNPYNYILTIAIFIVLKYFEPYFQNINKKITIMISDVAKNSLYIYVFHWFVCRIILIVFDKLNFVSPFSFYFSSFILAIIVLACTNLIIDVIRKFI